MLAGEEDRSESLLHNYWLHVAFVFGCSGNGKYLGVPARATAIGCDRSLPLAEICAQRGFQSLAADALCVPFRSNCADVVLSIAVIHHLSTHARRLAACSELLRLARPDGGVIFLQVCNLI